MPAWLFLNLIFAATAFAGDTLFHDDFQRGPKPGWTWIREDQSAWRTRNGALEIRIQPGNMWGPENSGKNILVRSLPATTRPLEISMIAEHHPTGQYEQVDLVCYEDDSNMVKIGEELVDGKLSVVMGREQGDKTRTIAIIPLDHNRVELRLRLEGKTVTGQFRPGAAGEWRVAGGCDLPAGGMPRAAIQCYQGPQDKEHWARIQNFRITAESP